MHIQLIRGESKNQVAKHAFETQAGYCSDITKGERTLVDGRLEIAEYTDENGEKRMTYRIVPDTWPGTSELSPVLGKQIPRQRISLKPYGLDPVISSPLQYCVLAPISLSIQFRFDVWKQNFSSLMLLCL